MHFLQRYRLWGLLILLIVLNAVVFWPKKKSGGAFADRSFPPGEFGGPPREPDAKMKARFEAMLKNMTAEERSAFEERRKADRAFFESLKNLSGEERRKKMEEHRAANPPPPTPAGQKPGPPPMAADGDNGDGGKGGPAGNGGPHVPSPSVRRGMDQRIVDSQGGGS